MVYADELMRVSLIWKPDTDYWPNEMAVNTFHLQHVHHAGNTFDWPTAVQYAADTIASKLSSHWSGISGYHAQGYQVTTVKTAQIATTGKYTVEGVHALAGGTCAGTGTSGVMPPEVAIALSMYGYTPGSFVADRGQKRGRIYLPYLSTTLADSHGHIQSPGDVSDAWAAFFNDLQGMHTDAGEFPDHDYYNLVVASKVGGIATQVTTLAVDNVFDSQRRREHQAHNSVRAYSSISH